MSETSIFITISETRAPRLLASRPIQTVGTRLAWLGRVTGSNREASTRLQRQNQKVVNNRISRLANVRYSAIGNPAPGPTGE